MIRPHGREIVDDALAEAAADDEGLEDARSGVIGIGRIDGDLVRGGPVQDFIAVPRYPVGELDLFDPQRNASVLPGELPIGREGISGVVDRESGAVIVTRHAHIVGVDVGQYKGIIANGVPGLIEFVMAIALREIECARPVAGDGIKVITEPTVHDEAGCQIEIVPPSSR